MKSVRLFLFAILAATALFGASACLSESNDDGLNPQPLPPVTEPPPENPGQGGATGAFGDDKNGAGSGGGSSGSSGAPPVPQGAADGGIPPDAGKMRYEIKVW